MRNTLLFCRIRHVRPYRFSNEGHFCNLSLLRREKNYHFFFTSLGVGKGGNIQPFEMSWRKMLFTVVIPSDSACLRPGNFILSNMDSKCPSHASLISASKCPKLTTWNWKGDLRAHQQQTQTSYNVLNTGNWKMVIVKTSWKSNKFANCFNWNGSLT